MSPSRRGAAALVLASLALFLALGGPGLASRAATKPVYQQKCATGAVKAVVGLTADPSVGFQKAYTADAKMFGVRWACKKAAFQAMRVDRGDYRLRVVGLPGTPIVTPLGGPVKVGVSMLSDGGIEVHLLGDAGGAETAIDEPFVVIFV